MVSSLGNATTRGDAIISNTRATLMDLLLQVEVARTRRQTSSWILRRSKILNWLDLHDYLEPIT